MKVTILATGYRGVSVQTHMSILNAMSVLGWPHRIVSDDALLDHARGVLVSDWYRQTDDEAFVMVDNDMLFFPNDLLRLVGRPADVVSAVYPARLGQTLTGTPLDVGQDGSALRGTDLIELERAGMGCIAVKRHVIARLVNLIDECDTDGGQRFWPLFMHGVSNGRYYGEDTAFCRSVRAAGFRIWLDPTVRVAHMSGELPVTMDNMHIVRQAFEAYQKSLAGGTLIAA